MFALRHTAHARYGAGSWIYNAFTWNCNTHLCITKTLVEHKFIIGRSSTPLRRTLPNHVPPSSRLITRTSPPNVRCQKTSSFPFTSVHARNAKPEPKSSRRHLHLHPPLRPQIHLPRHLLPHSPRQNPPVPPRYHLRDPPHRRLAQTLSTTIPSPSLLLWLFW